METDLCESKAAWRKLTKRILRGRTLSRLAGKLEMYMEDKINKKTESEEPLVSIIIPIYNGEKFIREAIESVINQSYHNWELIVVDDGSTDSSKDIVRQYITDRRVRLIEHECNKGIPKTKNTGIKLARGDYIAFLDQDDIWFSTKLEIQVNYLRNCQEDVGMICTGMVFTDEKLKPQRIFRGFKDDNQKELIKSIYLQPDNSTSIMMVKKRCFSVLGFFDESFHGWDDFEMWMRIATQYKIKYIKEVMVKKRVHAENVQTLPHVQKEARKVFDQILQLHPFLKAYKGEKEVSLLYLEAVALLRQKEKDQSKLKLKEAMKGDHHVTKPLFLFILISFLGNRAIWVKDQLSMLMCLLQSLLLKITGC